jgi:hypothetical protein
LENTKYCEIKWSNLAENEIKEVFCRDINIMYYLHLVERITMVYSDEFDEIHPVRRPKAEIPRK